LTYGGRAAAECEAAAAKHLIGRFSETPEQLSFPEIAVLERDGYGRVMIYVRVAQAGGGDEELLVVFKHIEPDGSYAAGPKALLRVRPSSYSAGLEYHKVRNSWDCPLE